MGRGKRAVRGSEGEGGGWWGGQGGGRGAAGWQTHQLLRKSSVFDISSFAFYFESIRQVELVYNPNNILL